MIYIAHINKKAISVADGLAILTLSQESRFEKHALMPSNISSRIAANVTGILFIT